MYEVGQRIRTTQIRVDGLTVFVEMEGVIKGSTSNYYRMAIEPTVIKGVRRTSVLAPKHSCEKVTLNDIFVFKGEREGWKN